MKRLVEGLKSLEGNGVVIYLTNSSGIQTEIGINELVVIEGNDKLYLTEQDELNEGCCSKITIPTAAIHDIKVVREALIDDEEDIIVNFEANADKIEVRKVA